MKSRSILSCLVVLSLLVASMMGCSKEEEAPPVKEESTPEVSVQAAAPESTEPVASPAMEQFLASPAGSGSMTVHDQIGKFFDFWGQCMRNSSRKPMDIHFEVELEENFQKDHTMKGKTGREFLDDVCQENNLVWTITKLNTIRITKRPK